MTMHIYFLVDKDGYKEGEAKFVERTLARRFCENGVAMPYQQHREAEDRKAELLKKQKIAKAESAASKKAPRRSKAVKKVVKKQT